MAAGIGAFGPPCRPERAQWPPRGPCRTAPLGLEPGGVLLATVPGISQVADLEWNDTWYWSLTRQSARRLCLENFEPELVEVKAHGNVLTAICFLQGLADHELTRAELDVADAEYPVTITIKAHKGQHAVQVARETPAPCN